MNNKCKHEIIYIQKQYDRENNLYHYVGKCLFCEKEFSEKDLKKSNLNYIINEYITLDDGVRIYVSFKLLKDYATKLSKKHYKIYGEKISTNLLYSLLTKYYR